LILNLEVIAPDQGEIKLWMRLMAEAGTTGRPDEVLEEMGFENTAYLVKRTRLILTET